MANRKSKRSSKRKTHNRKIMKLIKLTTLICFLFLVIELVYIGYNLMYNSKKNIYFDGINSIVSRDNYYVTVGSNNDNDNYYEKAKITLYNNKKVKTLEKLYNVGFNSTFLGVEIDSENNIIAVGNYEKTDTDHNKSIRRALVVKYDKDGNVLFDKEFSKLDNSKFTDVVIYEENYYVIGQTVYSNTKIGNKDGGALINKYDKNGELIWSKTFGNSKNAIYNDVVLKDNYLYVVGSNNYDGLFNKYDLDGNLVYSNNNLIGYEFSSIVELNNNLYISGSYKVDDGTDAFIGQFDLDGNLINSVSYQGKDYDKYNRIIKDNNNNIIAIGIMTTYRNKKSDTIDEFDYDGIIGKYKSNLEKVGVITYGDENDDFFTDVILDDNNYLVIGYSSYEDGSYLSKFINYSSALKVLEVE
ncbi:MAG: hypothetical protein IJ463_08145 [Bacilli bacterium]|nr:hypothetical protein [Bacilli bacterium]